MYLEKIELQGFKSFAHKTKIDFPRPIDANHHGITAIVGPNGSGKSNVVDAIKWVLGEQSAKTLRSKNNQDVIFAGSQNKARMGMAEVTLYFNNEDKIAPVDYKEIVITRRLYRDGESEYILNKNKVRLSDIIMLLAQCNVGQKSYSIIGQGMITQIVTASPSERKSFFDEATGIKQFQIKRDKAASKLIRTEENLEQSNQILSELEPRLKLLKRQVNKLNQRKELESELELLQSEYYSFILNSLEHELGNFSKHLKNTQETQSELENQLTIYQKELDRFSQEESRQHIYNELQNEYNEIILEKNKITQSLAEIKGKSNVEYSKIGKQNISWLQLKEEEIAEKINFAHQELEKLQQEILDSKEKIHSLEKNEIEAEKKLHSMDVTLAQSQRDDNNNVILSKGHIHALLREKNNFDGIIGTVSQLGNIESRYSTALEVAAGKHLESIVVEDVQTAQKCINFLKENRLGTANFLPLTKIKPRTIYSSTHEAISTAGVIDLAINLVDFEDKYRNLFLFVFGGTLIVHDIDTAKRVGVGNERMVTLDGDILETSGAMRGGFRKYKSTFKFQTEHGVSMNIQAIEKLEQERHELVLKKQNFHNQINQLKISIEIKHSQVKMNEKNIQSLQSELEKITRDLKQSQITPENQSEVLQSLENEKNTLQETLQTLENQLTEKRNKINQFNKDEETKQQKVFEIQHEKQLCQEQLNSINTTYNELSIKIARIETQKEDIIKELVEELGLSYQAKLTTPKEINKEEHHKQIRLLKQRLNLIGGIDPEVISEYDEVNARYEFLSEQIGDSEKALKDLKKLIGELDETIKKQFNQSFKKINEKFNEFFTKLFLGGKAKLELLHNEDDEESDVNDEMVIKKKNNLTTGIEIIAAPPNKKIKNLSVLSGGEKTMTAIALICAIISNTKAPFVILDEVDAALDEANSDKLANIVSELSGLTQFIIITHNRVMMHAANLLYGVAMNEDGITKLLSLNLNEAEKLVE